MWAYAPRTIIPLELEMRSPMPQLPLLLLHCTRFPVPRHAVEAHGGMLDRTGGWTRPARLWGMVLF